MAAEVTSLGGRLRRLREAAGLTQEGLAERAGLSVQAVAALESGRRQRPHPSTVQAISDALGLSAPEREALAEVVRARATSGGEAARPQLPVPPTPLIGRERELAELERLLHGRETRLLTLVGPGGVGKTRLALAVATKSVEIFSDGVVFVPLAPVGDPALVIPTLARSLGLVEVGGQPLLETLLSYLQQRRVLLVLDNLEQVLGAAPDVAGLVASCPELTLLTTSRAPLRVRGEREYPVRPLGVPELDRIPGPEVEASPAAQLFLDRARSSSPSFALTRTNAPAVAAICRRLDGLPLALELAAARVRTLSPTELLARLDHSLPLLTGGARDLPERQRTMRAAIEWSYQLLREPEWRLLNRLSVFRGGWDLGAAEAVGADEDIGQEEVLDLLSSLVEQSLVVAETHEEGHTRYRLLVPVREYTEERLLQSGEAHDTRRRHVEYYAGLAAIAEAELKGPEQVAWLDRLETEHDNYRATLGWLIAHAQTEAAAELGYSLWIFWWMRGHFTEGRHWMEKVMLAEPTLKARAWASLVKGILEYGQGEYDLADVSIETCLPLFEQMGHELRITDCYAMGALIAIGRKQYDRAAPLAEEGFKRYRSLGEKWGGAMLLTYAAAVPLALGDPDRAARLAMQALELAQEIGDRVGVYSSLCNLATLAFARGDSQEAARLFRRALLLSVDIGDQGNSAYCLEGLAAVAAVEGQVMRAAWLWGAAESLLGSGEAAVYAYAADRVLQRSRIADARSQADADEWTQAWERGGAMSLERVVEYALTDEDAAD